MLLEINLAKFDYLSMDQSCFFNLSFIQNFFFVRLLSDMSHLVYECYVNVSLSRKELMKQTLFICN